MQELLVGIGVVVFLGWLILSPISWFSPVGLSCVR